MPLSSKRILLAGGLAALSVAPALGDLAAALRRGSSGTSSPVAVLPADAALSGSVAVPLRRVGVRGPQGGPALLDAPAGLSFYVGRISLGHPAQELEVMFDTASGHVLLPHRACSGAGCAAHHRFSPWESSTAMDVNLNGSAVQEGRRFAQGNGTRDGVSLSYTQSDLGTGDAKGVLVRDSVCVAPGACVDMGILAATHMDEKPFLLMPGDGIVGLGLEALAAGPLYSFLGRLFKGSRNVRPEFGIALGAELGEIHFGGHDGVPLAAPLQWFPVDHPEQGYWQVSIRAVRVGNETVHACEKGCHGIVDTGVSSLGVQASYLPSLSKALGVVQSREGGCQGPDLTLELGGMALTLPAEAYADSDCRLLLGSLDLEEPEFVGVFALGAAVLRHYYAAFDWEQQRLAFAPLKAGGVQAVARPGSEESSVIVV